MKKVTYTKNDIINSISNDNNISYSESAVMVNIFDVDENYQPRNNGPSFKSQDNDIAF